jgi:hypothetical protein
MKNYGGMYLSKSFIGLLMLFVFIFATCLSLAQDSANASANASTLENVTAVPVETPPENATLTNETVANETVDNATATEVPAASETGAASAPANLNYIWSVSGIEKDVVTMVLNQSGESLSGSAKYEAADENPWNAIVVGSVTGDKADLVMTALKGASMVSTKMTGTFSGDTITGQFVQSDSSGKTTNGEFSATWINPDTSSYMPAKIEESSSVSSTSTNTTTSSSYMGSVTTGSDALGPTPDGSSSESTGSKYVDVSKYKHQYETGGDLSGIPPGMG